MKLLKKVKKINYQKLNKKYKMIYTKNKRIKT